MSPADSMVTQSLPTNFTSIVNYTDYDCEAMPVGLVLMIISIPSACVGVPANVWLLWLLVQRQRSGLSVIYTLHLTLLNLIINITTFPAVLNSVLWKDARLAVILNIVFFCCVSGRPVFMTCICVDCYSGTVVEKSFRNQKVASSIPCRSVLEQDTEPLIAPDVQCAISVNVKNVYTSL